MGRDFFEESPEARAVFQKGDELLGFPFSDLIFQGPSEELTQTKNSQLAIFIVSMAIYEALKGNIDLKPTFAAGLSLGEYSALCAAGLLSFEEALLIVKARGAYMQEACETQLGTMQVVLGMELSLVQEVASAVTGAWIANLNCPGQIVISGTKEGMDKVATLLKEKGARRVMPLEVSGAFHSGLMKSAQEKLAPMIQQSSLHMQNSLSVVMNVTGAIPTTKEAIRQAMIDQVTSSVLWQKGVELMDAQGVELFIEMGPGKTLAGMNKKIGCKASTVSIEKVTDMAGALAALKGEMHAST